MRPDKQAARLLMTVLLVPDLMNALEALGFRQAVMSLAAVPR
jgi:hypothetical protein